MLYFPRLISHSQVRAVAQIIRDKRLAKGEIPLPLLYSNLSSNAKLIYGVLDSYGQNVFASIERSNRRFKTRQKKAAKTVDEKSDFELRSSLSASSIRRGLDELITAGFLQVVQRDGKAHIYYLTVPEKEELEKSDFSYKWALAEPKFVTPKEASQSDRAQKARQPDRAASQSGTPASQSDRPTIKGLTKSLKKGAGAPVGLRQGLKTTARSRQAAAPQLADLTAQDGRDGHYQSIVEKIDRGEPLNPYDNLFVKEYAKEHQHLDLLDRLAQKMPTRKKVEIQGDKDQLDLLK